MVTATMLIMAAAATAGLARSFAIAAAKPDCCLTLAAPLSCRRTFAALPDPAVFRAAGFAGAFAWVFAGAFAQWLERIWSDGTEAALVAYAQ